jgi:hypothetical protein
VFGSASAAAAVSVAELLVVRWYAAAHVIGAADTVAAVLPDLQPAAASQPRALVAQAVAAAPALASLQLQHLFHRRELICALPVSAAAAAAAEAAGAAG